MSVPVPRPTIRRLSTIVVTFLVVATLQASLPGPVLGATPLTARCDGANLRTRATTGSVTKVRLKAGTRVVATKKVSGGRWHSTCAGASRTGTTWWRIKSINGKSVQSRYGVRFLYAAKSLFRKVSTTTAPPSPSCTRTTKADATGSTDVTSALQNFIDASPAGSVICFAAGGRYRVNGTLHVLNRSRLTFDGNGATVFQTTRSRAGIWRINGSSNDITLRNMTIKGANPSPGVWNATYEHNHGIEVGGATNLNLGHLTILNVGGDGLYLSAGQVGSGVRWADSVRFHDSVIDGTGRSGVSIADGASNVVIDYNTMRRIAYYTFNIEPNGHVWNGVAAGARSVRFSDNKLGPQPYGTGANGQPVGHVFVVTGSSGGGPVDGIQVSRNTVSGRPFDVGVYNNGGLRRNIRVVDNRSDTRVKGPVMYFAGVSTLVVTGNVQPLSGSPLVSTSGCTDVTISGNVTS